MTEEEIIAYVDGELGPIEASRFERAMAADPALAAEVARHRRVREAVTRHFAPIALEPLPARLSGLVDHGENVVAFPTSRSVSRPFRRGGRYAALAAALVAGLALGQLLPSPAGRQDGALPVQGALAAALDRQLASGPQDTSYRIGVSFRTADNRYCRTFTGTAGAGIGCHGDEGWALERFVAGDASDAAGVYRQASSPAAEIAAAAQEMMAGAPLDAAAERAARDRGWSATP